MEWCTVDEKLDKITIEHFARVLALISTRLLQSDNSRRTRKHSCFYRVVFASVFSLLSNHNRLRCSIFRSRFEKKIEEEEESTELRFFVGV